MLQNIRDRMTGYVAGFIITLLVLSFALWGINSYFQPDPDPVVVEVGDSTLASSQLDNIVQQRLRQLREQYSRANVPFPEQLYTPAVVRREAVDSFAQREALKQYALERGYRFTDSQILEVIDADEGFKEDGKFSGDLYKATLAGRGFTPARYEANIRETGLVAQVQLGLNQTSFVTEAEARRRQALLDQQRDIQVVEVSHTALRDAIVVSEEEVKAFYEERAADLMTEAEAKVNFIEVKMADMEPEVDLSEENLKARYEQNVERWTEQEQRKARHILVSKDKDNAEQVAGDLLKQLQGGADFDELARANSDDPGSANDGGDLGWVLKGQMVPPFEEALFALEEGKLSDVVKSRFGFHIIRLDELKAGSQREFTDAEVQQSLKDELREEAVRREFDRQLRELQNLAFELDDLQSVVDESGFDLKVQTTDFFTAQKGDGIAAEAAVRSAAFSPAVRDDARNSDVIRLLGDRAVIVHMAEYKAPAQLAFDDVKGELQEELLDKRAKEQAQELGQALLAKWQQDPASGSALADANTAYEFKEFSDVTRNGGDTNPQVRQAAFKLAKPAADAPSIDGVELFDGNYAVVRLVAVKAPEQTPLAEAQKRQFASMVAGWETGFLMKQLREQAQVEINEAVLERDTSEAL